MIYIGKWIRQMKEVIQHLYAHYGIMNSDEYVMVADQHASQQTKKKQDVPERESSTDHDDVAERHSSPADGIPERQSSPVPDGIPERQSSTDPDDVPNRQSFPDPDCIPERQSSPDPNGIPERQSSLDPDDIPEIQPSPDPNAAINYILAEANAFPPISPLKTPPIKKKTKKRHLAEDFTPLAIRRPRRK